jgi:hypothetical protein
MLGHWRDRPASAFQVGHMRQTRRTRRPPAPQIPDDSIPIDLGATVRQIGLFETGIGWQHGVLDILVALGAALLWLPVRSFLRSGSRDRH